MAELVRWSLMVSRATDIALRTFLAARGEKGDLSRFVEEAVNRAVLRESIRDIQTRKADVDPDELDRLVEEELTAVRPVFWVTDRH